jgi:glycosyltransferase 2 family protein
MATADAPEQPRPLHRRLWFQLQVWLGLLLGIAALVLVARSIDFARLGSALAAVRWPFVALTVVTSLLTPVLKAQRWRWLFHPKRITASTLSLASLVTVGQAVNFLVPGRWGELVRTYLTGDELGVSKWFALGTIAAEKLIDLVVLALLVVALLPFVVLPAGIAAQIEVVLLTALAVVVGVVALLGGRGLWLRLADWALRFLPPATAARWHQRIVAGLDGLSALGSRRAALAVWGWTAAFWIMSWSTGVLLLVAFDLPPSPVIGLTLLVVLQGGVAVPSTPGKVGVFQLLCMAVLTIFAVPDPVSLAYGLVLHVLVVGGICMWAALALWRRSWSWRRLAEASAGLSSEE